MDKQDKPFQVAILLYPGVTALAAAGPWEVLSRMPYTEVQFVGKEIGPLQRRAPLSFWASRTP
jgi:putative intracellular protease/amidase